MAYLTVAEAAAVFRVTPRTIRYWLRQGKLVARKIGRKWLIPHEEMDHERPTAR